MRTIAFVSLIISLGSVATADPISRLICAEHFDQLPAEAKQLLVMFENSEQTISLFTGEFQDEEEIILSYKVTKNLQDESGGEVQGSSGNETLKFNIDYSAPETIIPDCEGRRAWGRLQIDSRLVKDKMECCVDEPVEDDGGVEPVAVGPKNHNPSEAPNSLW